MQLSVNCGINIENFPMAFLGIDDVVRKVRQIGRGALIFKSDCVDAFRIIPICPADIPLLGISYNKQLYLDTRLVFGIRSGPSSFSALASQLNQVFSAIIQTRTLSNYQDDFFYMTHRTNFLSANIALSGFKDFMAIVGMELAIDKTVAPSTTQVILGHEIDTQAMTVSVPQHRMDALRKLLCEWRDRHSATKQELQSLIGVLVFCSYGVRWSRAFIRRLLDAMASLVEQDDVYILDSQTQADISWWIQFMREWNGVSIMVDWRPIQVEWHFYTDSSKPRCAGVWGDKWWFYDFTTDDHTLLPDINCQELFAVVTQCTTFALDFSVST